MKSKSELTKNKFLTSEELAMLTKLLVRFPSRDTALILLAIHTGARAGELLGIKKEDLNDQEQTVFIRGSKGSKDREIPILHSVFIAVQNYIPFEISYSRLNQIWDMYRPVNKPFHALRHTFAIELYKRTKDIKLVQICLGHRQLTSTQVYQDFIYEQTELRRLIIPNITT